MSTNGRLERLERHHGDDGRRVAFRVVTPPPGLTAAEHDQWSAEQRQESAARGEYSFTLDLGASVIQ